jgi:GTPase SAR1 family protein
VKESSPAATAARRVMADGLQTAEKVRILVLGDSGVGKTSLVELVCSGAELRKPRS